MGYFNFKKKGFLSVAVLMSFFAFIMTGIIFTSEAHAASSCKNCKCAQLVFDVTETKKKGNNKTQISKYVAYSNAYCAPVENGKITGKFVLSRIELIEEGVDKGNTDVKKRKNWANGALEEKSTEDGITITLFNVSKQGFKIKKLFL